MRIASMMVGALTGLLIVVAAFALDPPRPAKPPVRAVPDGQPQVLDWDDLMPVNERKALLLPPSRPIPLFDDESGPAAIQKGSSAVNLALHGKQIKIPGFIVPLSIDKNLLVTEFLLVPYFGACMHEPPPPPNQIVHVVMRQPFRSEDIYDPVWVTGLLSTKSAKTSLAKAAYSLAGQKITKYQEPPR